GRVAVRMINGLPALVADVPSDNPRIARRVVVLVSLDAQGKIARIDSVVASAKLRAIDFHALEGLSGKAVGEWLLAGVQRPSLSTWFPRALRAGAASGLSQLGARLLRRKPWGLARR